MLAVVGQRAREPTSGVLEEMSMVVGNPQLIIRIGDHTQNREFRFRTRIVAANGLKSESVISDQPFAGAEPDVPICGLSY